MTPRFLLLVVLICSLVLAGLAFRQPGLLILAIPLILFIGAGFLLAPGELHLEAERRLTSDRMPFGTPLEVSLVLRSQGESLEELQLEEDVFPPLTGIEGPALKLLPLPAGGEAVLEYVVRGQRGKYEFKGAAVTARDPFDLIRGSRTIPAPATVFIFPQVLHLPRIPIRPRRTHGFAGPIPSRRGGSGIDFFGLREYQPGDLQRHLNWKRAAREVEELYTNEYEQETTGDVGIILDARERTNIHLPNDSLFEHSVIAAASLAERFLNEGHPVSLVIYGASMERVFPGYGSIQKDRLLQALARARTGRNFAMESLNRLPTRFFPPRSQLLIVSPMVHSDLSALTQLLAQGYSILILSPNPVAYETRLFGHGRRVEIATRLAQAERKLMLQKVRRLGIRLINWQTDQPLEGAIRADLSRQPLHHMRGVL